MPDEDHFHQFEASSIEGIPLGKAHLSIKNLDSTTTYELWAQSEECYSCSPWKYLTLRPYELSHLTVNSTYPTNIFLQLPHNLHTIHNYKFHFVQRGVYSLQFNSSYFPHPSVLHRGDNEYTALLGVFLSFFFMNLIWCGVNFLQNRMNEDHFRLRNSSTSEGQSSASGTVEDEQPLVVAANSSSVNRVTEQISSCGSNARLGCLDIFRGISIVIMIFANYGGGSYYMFQHSVWNGLTVADLAFPWFMWIMGMSMVFSIKSQLRRLTPYRAIVWKILKRSLTLFTLGLVINSINSNYLPELRIPGVLQRFSLCYLINALLETFLMFPQEPTEYFRLWKMRDIVWSWYQWMAMGLLVLLHLIIVFLLPVPGCPTGYLGPGGLHEGGKYPNCTGGATTYVDLVVFGRNHLHGAHSIRKIYDCFGNMDPEGLLGILTSCLQVQFGLAAGRIILYYSNHEQRLKRWLIWGVFTGVLGGILCDWSKELGVIPVNKRLWSLSYVFVTSSFAFILLSVIYYFSDWKKWWSGYIFKVAGMNSILLYVGHEITKKLFPFSWKPLPPYNKYHLAMSIWGTCLWLLIAFVCHKKKFYLSV